MRYQRHSSEKLTYNSLLEKVSEEIVREPRSHRYIKYSGYQIICDTIFAIFTVLWIVTRLGVFPLWIIQSTSIEAPKIVPMIPAYYIFNGLLIWFLVLHVFWTHLIWKITYNSLNAGQMEDDIRSNNSNYSEDSKSQKH